MKTRHNNSPRIGKLETLIKKPKGINDIARKLQKVVFSINP